MRSRLYSRFVGRVEELAELELCLRAAAEGRPAVVLIGGDSGVGKTRLISEFARRQDEGDVLLLRGEGLEQGDADLPYASLLGALRPLVRARHPAFDAISPAARGQLAALLPAIGDDSAPGGDDVPSQLRLFEAMLELLAALCEDGAAVLVLEDMHWADGSTRRFAEFLARGLDTERLLLVLTYRSDELHRRHPLRPLISELQRLERARTIQLEPFDRGELTEALTDILGRAPDEELVERLFARSEGNPLYSEELLAAGLDGRGPTPHSLHDAFMLRVERLPDDAQRTARVVAAGGQLDERTIAAVTGWDAGRMTAALREAVAQHILTPGRDGRIGFRHALLREAVYDDLLPGERGELHLSLARAFEHDCADTELGEVEIAAAVAHHYEAAGDQPGALRAAVAAAQAAVRVHAPVEAAALADRALELWPRVPASERPLERVELLVLSADAHAGSEEHGRVEAVLLEALDELGESGDLHRQVALLTRLARAQWWLNRGGEAMDTAQRAQALLSADDASVERVAVLAWLARTRLLRGRFRDALTEGEQALEAAQALDDGAAERGVLSTIGMAQILLGDVQRGEESLRRALELALAAGDAEGAAMGYDALADALHLAGRTTDALEAAREGLDQLPRRLVYHQQWIRLNLSEIALTLGRWELARRYLDAAPGSLAGRLLLFRHLREAELALGEGDDAAAERCLDAVAGPVADSFEPQWHGTYGALLADLRRRRGELAEGRAAVQQALDRLELCTDDVIRIARVSAAGVAVEADIAQRARDLREPADERDALIRAGIHLDRLAAAASEGGPVERAWLAVGHAEMSRARAEADPGLYESAARAWDELARPYWSAQARWRQAEALVERDERDAALEPAREALEVARGLGARWLAGEVVSLCARARLELAGGDGARPSEEAEEDEDEAPFGLTPRERQVLALIAQGATNRQIGQALYMAEKTASVHVSRILAKLGVRSRTQAAAVAHRQHLA